MKSPSTKRSSAKDRILHAAAELFHKQGFQLTSPDQVIEVSGTGKSQFYHYFKNKEGLVHEVLQFHLQRIESGTARVNFEVGSWSELEEWFHRHIEFQKTFNMTRGCPIATIGNDATLYDELIRQDVALILEVLRQKLLAFFLREKATGGLARDANEEALATFCIAAVHGAMLLGKVTRNSRPAELTISEAVAHIKRYATGSRGVP